MMVSISSKYYQVFLTQGLLLGLSNAFLTIPSVVIVNRHFKKHRGLATGVTIAGSSVGGIVWPIVLENLLNRHGLSFGWTVRAVGFIMIVPTTLATLLTRPPLQPAASAESNADSANAKPSPPEKKLNFSILRNPTYVLFVVGAVVFNLALFSPFFYLTSYAVSIGMSTSFAFYLLSILSGASMFGRIGMGIIADKFGPFNLTAVVALLSAIVLFCWTAATSIAGVVVWAIAAGFTSGVGTPFK
jgi:predicted MFS family arabinose efflux permease